MGVDYYKILQVHRGAKDDDLKKSFKRISEAYFVLSDPEKRAIYDRYGEEGLKGQVPPPGDGGRPFSPSGAGTGGQTTRNANDLLAEFFGSSSPFGSLSPSGGMGGGGGGGGGAGGMRGGRSMNADDIFAEFFGSSNPFRSMGGGGGGGAGDVRAGRIGPFGEDVFESSGGKEGIGGMGSQMKEAAIERILPFSLEELYKGTTKKMKISREIAHASGKTMPMEEILTIEIKPGWKKGTKITFPEKGNERPNVMPADLVFIVDEKPHSVFTRDGNDLTVTQKISLAEALTGYTVSVTTLDGRTLTLPINSIIHPEYEEVVVPKEGMPLPKDPSRKGNLRIKFNIKFPSHLSSEQKAGIKRLLAP